MIRFLVIWLTGMTLMNLFIAVTFFNFKAQSAESYRDLWSVVSGQASVQVLRVLPGKEQK